MRPRDIPSIRQLLLTLVLVPLVPAVIALAALLAIAYGQAKQHVVERTAAAARDIGFPVLRRLHDVMSGLEQLAAGVPREREKMGTFRAEALTARESLGLSAIVLLDRHGRVLLNTRLAAGSPLGEAPAAARATLDTGKAAVSTLFIGPTARVPVIIVSVPVFFDGTLLYSINAAMEATSFQPLLQTRALAPGWVATLADRDGSIITRTRNHAGYVGTRLPVAVLAHADATELRAMTDVPMDGEPAYTAVRRGVDFRWILMAQAPQSELVAPLRRALTIASIALGCALAVSLLLVARIGRQIVSSVEGVARAGGGEGAAEPVPVRLHFREANVLARQLRETTALGHASARRLSERERQLQGILDSAWDAIVTIDEDHRIQIFNKAAEAMFQRPRQEVIGAKVETLMPQEHRTQHAGHIQLFAQEDSPQPPNMTRMVCGLRASGETFPLEASISSFMSGEGRRFFTAILRDVTESRRRQQQLESARVDLQKMSQRFERQLLAEVELRQAAVAHELHDSIGSALSGVSMLLASATAAADVSAAASPWLQRCLSEVEKTAGLTRRLARGILPVGADTGALVHALEQFTSDTNEFGSVQCRLAVDGDFNKVTGEVGNHVYRIVQEAVTNAFRHGHAASIEVRLAAWGDSHAVAVIDDGSGLRGGQGGGSAGLGMASMRLRAALIGGDIEWRNGAGGGCWLEVRWPTAGTAPQDH